MRRLPLLVVGTLLGAAAGVLAASLGATTSFERLEVAAADALARAFADAEKAATSRVKLVLVTDANLPRRHRDAAETPPDSQFARHSWGELVEALDERQLAAVVVDIGAERAGALGFPGSGADADRLARALWRSGRAVLSADPVPANPAPAGEQALPASAGVFVYGDSGCLPPSAAVVLPGEPLLSAADRIGASFIAADRDGVVRRLPLAFRIGDRHIPSFAMAAAMTVFGESSINIAGAGGQLAGFAGIDTPLDGAGNLPLNFRGPRGSFPTITISALDLALSGRERHDWLDNLKARDIVILGADLKGVPDSHATPTDKAMPSSEILATALDNLIRGDARATAPGLLQHLLTILLAALVGLAATLPGRSFLAPPVALLLVAAYLAAAVLAYRFGTALLLVTPPCGALLAYAGAATYRYRTEGRRRREIRRVFSQHVAPHLVRELESCPEAIQLGGERRTLTVFWSGIAGFAALSELQEPEALVQLLNDYLAILTAVIHEEHGTIDRYEADTVVAYWGAPIERADHATLALRAAARCQDALREFSARRQAEGMPALETRIGIGTGLMVVGKVGGPHRQDYTVIGETADLAAHLAKANAFFGSETIVSQETLAGAGPAVARPLGRVQVEGRDEPVRVHELLGAGDAGLPDLPEWAVIFAEGLQLLEAGDFKAAAALFRESDRSRADGDPVSLQFVRLCARFGRRKADSFDGVVAKLES